MSYPTPREVREALRATAPGTVLWEGRLEPVDIDEPSSVFFCAAPPLRQVVMGRRGRLRVWALLRGERGDEWMDAGVYGNRSVVQHALSRHGLCAPPVGWEEVVL